MQGKLFGVEGVIDVSIPENFTNATDANGLPPHSIAPIVDGGADDDIALTIYKSKNPGCALHPANAPVNVLVTSPDTGNSMVVTFSRPDYIDIVVVVDVVDGGTLPPTTEQEIIDAIILYADGFVEDVSGDAFNTNGFRIGDDVSVGRLYTPVNSVIGKYVGSYANAITIDGGIATIPIAFNERARFLESNITVNIL